MGGYATNPDTNATSEITGSGTANYMAKFTAAQVIGNSTVQDDGTTVSTVSKMSVGNYATPTNLRQFTVGQDTAYMSFGSVVSATSYSAIYFSSATPSGTNYTLAGDGTSTFLNAATNLYLRIGASNRITLTDNAISFTPNIVGSSAITSFTFTGSANTGQTASTEINRLLLTTSSRQWATGAITTQREVYITSPTYSFVGASTITDAYTLYATAPTASTNATITNSWAAGFQGNIQIGTSSVSAYAYAHITSAGSNDQAVILQRSGSTGWAIGRKNTNAVLSISYASSGIPTLGTGEYFTMQNYGAVKFTPIATTANAAIGLEWTGSLNTNQTASTDVNGWLITTTGRQWATGAITTQREVYITSPTYSFVGASTITSAYTLYVEAPTAGSNATITNNYALASAGAFQVIAGAIGNAGIVIRDWTASNTYGSIYMGVAPSTANYTILSNGADSFFNGTTQAIIRTNNISRLVVTSNSYSTSNTTFTFTPTTDVGQLASTEIPSLNYASGSRQWNTGAITTQREVYFRTQTYTAVGASTITNAYGLYVEKPTASTNITITNNWSIGTDGKIQATGYDMNAYGYVMTKAGIGIISNQFSSNGGFSIASQTLALPVGILVGGTDGVEVARFSGQTTTGATNQIAFSGSSTTGQTNLTEITGVLFNSYSRAWAAGIGTITTQREYYVKTVTYTQATNALTITNAYGMYVEAPTASTNVTITNNYALGLSGNLNIAVNNMGVWGVDSIGTARKLIFFTNTDNIQIIGRPGVSDIFIDPTASNTGALTIKSAGAIGVGAAVSPTAWLMLPAGSTGASKAPLKFTSGTNQTTAESGAMEYNNTFHLTNSDATRRHIVLAPNTTKVTAGAPYTNDGYIVINIGGTDFKLMTTA